MPACNDMPALKMTMGCQMELMISRAVSAKNRNVLVDLVDTFNGAAARVKQELDKMPAAEEKNAPPRFWP